MTESFKYCEGAHDYEIGCPEGAWTGRLDHKAWCKSSNPILFVTETGTAQRYWFLRFSGNNYSPKDYSISFRDAPDGSVFIFGTGKTETGNLW